jgi:hypothetical protein
MLVHRYGLQGVLNFNVLWRSSFIAILFNRVECSFTIRKTENTFPVCGENEKFSKPSESKLRQLFLEINSFVFQQVHII